MFPTSPAPLLTFLREVRVFMQQQRNPAHPAVVHCLSGVGRSGLVLLLLAAISDVQAARGLPDLVALVTRISSSRKSKGGVYFLKIFLTFGLFSFKIHCVIESI